MWLDEWLFKEGIQLQEFAEQLGVTQQYLGRIKSGKIRASKTLAKLIELKTKGQVTQEELLNPDAAKIKLPPSKR